MRYAVAWINRTTLHEDLAVKRARMQCPEIPNQKGMHLFCVRAVTFEMRECNPSPAPFEPLPVIQYILICE